MSKAQYIIKSGPGYFVEVRDGTAAFNTERAGATLFDLDNGVEATQRLEQIGLDVLLIVKTW